MKNIINSVLLTFFIINFVVAQERENSVVQDFLISDENTPSTFIQNDVKIFPFRADKYLAVWNDKRDGVPSSYAQVFDICGNLLGDNFKLESNKKIRTILDGSFINVSQENQDYFDISQQVFSGHFYDADNKLIKTVFLGLVQLSWCGTGYLGYNYECVNTSNQYIFLLRDNGWMNISKYDANGNKVYQIPDSLLESRAAIYSTIGSCASNDYAFVWLQGTHMFVSPTGVFGTFLSRQDSVLTADVPLGFPINTNNLYWYAIYKNTMKVIGLPDSTYLIFYLDVSSAKCYFRKFNRYGSPKSTLDSLSFQTNTSAQYAEIVNFLVTSKYENKFKVLITTRGSYPTFYHTFFTFDLDGQYVGKTYIDSTSQMYIDETIVSTSDSTYLIGLDDGKDAFLAATTNLKIDKLIKLNDDQRGSNESNPIVLQAEDNHFFVIWENETQIKGQKVNVNGQKVGSSVVLESKNIESFKDGTFLTLWRVTGIEGQDTIGFTIYGTNITPIYRNKIILCNQSQKVTEYKPLSDSTFVVVIRDNKDIVQLILVNKYYGQIKDIKITT